MLAAPCSVHRSDARLESLRLESHESAQAMIDQYNGARLPNSTQPLQVRYADNAQQKRQKTMQMARKQRSFQSGSFGASSSNGGGFRGGGFGGFGVSLIVSQRPSFINPVSFAQNRHTQPHFDYNQQFYHNPIGPK